MTKLYLIRHAEAEGNLFRRLHGQYNSTITPRGHRQIAALRERFRDIPIDAVYSSDLTRTCTTAEALSLPRALPIHRDRRLREVHAGIWEDRSFGYLEQFDTQRMHLFSTDVHLWSVEGSEIWEEYTDRMLQALQEIAHAHEGQTVAVFSHGLVLRGLLLRLFFPVGSRLHHCENTAVTCLRYHEGTFLLEYLNDASHITGELATLGRQLRWKKEHPILNLWYRDPTEADAPLLRALECPEGTSIRIGVLGDEAVGAVCMDQGLRHLALLPHARGFGLGQQLIGEAVSRFRKAGQTRLCLTAPATTPQARGIFAACGFDGDSFSLVPRTDF